MARLPELAALLGPRRPLEIHAAVFLRDLLHHLRLLDHGRLGAVEFQQQRRLLAVAGLVMRVERLHGERAQQFAARDRDAGLQGLDHGLGGAVDGGKRTNRRRHRRLHRVQLDGHLGDDAQRPLGAHEQARQVVARGRFLGAARSLDDAAVGQHHFQGHHVFAHRAVAHRVGARCARRGHAAQGRVRAGIDRKEQARVLDMLVQLLARDARLDHGVEVLFVHREHLVHLRKVDAHAALHREDVALERGADAVGDHRHAVRAADIDDVAHFFRGFQEYDDVRQGVGEIGLVLAVVLAHRLRGRDTVAEQRLQLRDHRLVEFAGLIHDLF